MTPEQKKAMIKEALEKRNAVKGKGKESGALSAAD